MVAQPVVYVDVESAVRQWARDMVVSVDRRVFFERSERAALPQIILYRVAGPDEACLVQFDVLASRKALAAEVAAELASEVDEVARYEHDGVILHAAAVDSVRWAPDPDTREPRYIVDATFVATATSTSS